jgi:hypothetical protein
MHGHSVTKKEKGALLQEAFREYTKMQQNQEVANKVEMVLKILKET